MQMESNKGSSLPTKHVLAGLVWAWILFLHLAGLSLFTRGFLLSRLALETKTTCSPESSCTLPPTHKRVVVLIIDSLRFDFISPDPPVPTSEHYHNALTLPGKLTKAHPHNSFIYNAYSDPPTATLQRIKGLTTGSLPTFVDIGSSFSASAIEEDSIISQLRASGKTIAFAGDDTWMSIFGKSFASNMSFPYDSFNVEDLHTVDEGVIRHLFPLLKDPHAGWDFFIGHFLGVDHVGHRLGPDHPTMKAKLSQMDHMLKQVVDALDDETLLVVLGDHGMDAKGDHGGDGVLETSTGLWVYSKSKPLRSESFSLPPSLSLTRLFPGTSVPYQWIQQIDLVPTLSLLLGLPIPYNNLGSIIPELFLRTSSTPSRFLSSSLIPDILDTAARLNAEQVMTYLQTYRSSSSGKELDPSWDGLRDAILQAKSLSSPTEGYLAFTRLALTECRALWAQFNGPMMIIGLVILVLSLPALGMIYHALATQRTNWETVGRAVLVLGWGCVIGGMFAGNAIAYAKRLAVVDQWLPTIPTFDWYLIGAALVSEIVVLGWNLRPTLQLMAKQVATASRTSTLLPVFLMVLHALSFTSNSFTMWEDRLVLFLLMTLVLPSLVTSFASPSAHLRKRIFIFGSIFALCVRLMSISTVCREEQHPYCHVTFYSSSTKPLSPLIVLILVVPIAIGLPMIVKRFLAASKSDKGAAPFSIDIVWRSYLVGGSMYWVLEWLESVYGQQADGVIGARSPWVEISMLIRTYVARVVLGGTFIGGYAFWWYAPLNIEIITEDASQEDFVKGEKPKKRAVVLGFANAYGSTYLLFILPFFALLWTVTQLTGQVVLALSMIAMLCYVELVDSQRDSRALSASIEGAASGDAQSTIEAVLDSTSSTTTAALHARSPTFAEPVALSLLAHLIFFSTGHQSVLPSIQWKTAFVGFPTLTYPFSPALVSLNTFGPFVLPALALPLFATWAVSPVQRGRVLVLSDTMRLAVGMALYYTALIVGAATSAAILRRHLMVWKVFAPRFMLAGVTLLVVDVALGIAVFIGGARAVEKVRAIFATDV